MLFRFHEYCFTQFYSSLDYNIWHSFARFPTVDCIPTVTSLTVEARNERENLLFSLALNANECNFGERVRGK